MSIEFLLGTVPPTKEPMEMTQSASPTSSGPHGATPPAPIWSEFDILRYRPVPPGADALRCSVSVCPDAANCHPRPLIINCDSGRPFPPPSARPLKAAMYSLDEISRFFALPLNFRFRDRRKALLQICSTAQYDFITGSAFHAQLFARFPRHMSRAAFANALLLLVFHTAAASGRVPTFWLSDCSTVQRVREVVSPAAFAQCAPAIGAAVYDRRVSLRATAAEESFFESRRYVMLHPAPATAHVR